MATHSSVLAWRIPGTEEPGRRLSMGSHRVGHDWSDLAAAAGLQGQGSESEVAQPCPTLCNPMDYIAHGIFQARILEWVAFPFSRGSSQPKAQIQVSHIAGGFFTSWATRESERKWSRVVMSDSLWPHGLYRLPGSPVHGIFQARVLEWVAISFSRGSFWPRDQTRVSRIVGRRFTVWATRKAHKGSPS